MEPEQALRLGHRIVIVVPTSVSQAPTIIYDVHTFSAIAAEEPVAHVMQGALNVPAVQPSVGDRNALSSKLSDPLLISREVSIKTFALEITKTYQLHSCTWLHSLAYSVRVFSR